jgi:hypothetical protein
MYKVDARNVPQRGNSCLEKRYIDKPLKITGNINIILAAERASSPKNINKAAK